MMESDIVWNLLCWNTQQWNQTWNQNLPIEAVITRPKEVRIKKAYHLLQEILDLHMNKLKESVTKTSGKQRENGNKIYSQKQSYQQCSA